MKKVICCIVAIIVLVIGSFLIINKTSLFNKYKGDSIGTIDETNEVISSLYNSLSDKKNRTNMTVKNNLEYHFDNDYYKESGSYKSNIYISENATYYVIKYNLIYETLGKNIKENGISKTYYAYDMDIEVYETLEKRFIKFNHYVVTNYKSENGEVIKSEEHNLFSGEAIKYKSKWIDMTESKLFRDIDSINQDFIYLLSDNISDNKAFTKKFRKYTLLEDNIVDFIENSNVYHNAKYSGINDFDSELIIDLSKKHIKVDFSMNGEHEYDDVSCYEKNELEIININNTIVEDIDGEVLVYEDVKSIFDF